MGKTDTDAEQRRRFKNKCSAKRSRDARKSEFLTLQTALEAAKRDCNTMFQHTQALMQNNAAQAAIIEDLRRQISVLQDPNKDVMIPAPEEPTGRAWLEVLVHEST